MAATLTVQGADGTYPMIVQPGALVDGLPQFAVERGFTRTVVVTNTTLAPLYGDALAGRLPGGHLIVLPDGEEYKTLATIETIYTHLLEAGADRSTLIVAASLPLSVMIAGILMRQSGIGLNTMSLGGLTRSSLKSTNSCCNVSMAACAWRAGTFSSRMAMSISRTQLPGGAAALLRGAPSSRLILRA